MTKSPVRHKLYRVLLTLYVFLPQSNPITAHIIRCICIYLYLTMIINHGISPSDSAKYSQIGLAFSPPLER